MESKKKRMGNFTQAEKFLLADILCENKNIIENKKTDAVTSKHKEACWSKVAVEFNSKSAGESRSVASLKNCWENLKKRTRKHFAEIRRERFTTGGGKMDVPEDPLCDRVKAVIEPSVVGLLNPFDSDAILVAEDVETAVASTSSDCNDNEDEDESMVMETLDDNLQNWSQWNPAMLRKKKSRELEATPSQEELTFADVDAAIQSHTVSKAPPLQSMRTSAKRKRPVVANSAPRINAAVRNRHFAALAESKLELVEMMKEDLRGKMELERQILETQLQKERLEVELLKKELQIKDAILATRQGF